MLSEAKHLGFNTEILRSFQSLRMTWREEIASGFALATT